MSDRHSTRSNSPAGNPHYREAARASIALARSGAAPTLEQSVALERIRVRLHGRANRHELGTWRQDPAAAGVELLACIHCGAVGRLELASGAATLVELLEACK